MHKTVLNIQENEIKTHNGQRTFRKKRERCKRVNEYSIEWIQKV